MKHIINAANGTLEFPENLHVDIFPFYLNNKNAWEYIGSEFGKIYPGDIIVGASFYGVNGAGIPGIYLNIRCREFGTSNFRAIRYLSDGLINSFQLLTNINYVMRTEDLLDCLYEQYPVSTLEIMIDNASNFSGHLHGNFYIYRGSR